MNVILQAFGFMFMALAIFAVIGGCLIAILNSIPRKPGRQHIDEETGLIVEDKDE